MEKNKKNRWQINKLGIINFWYFDKEEIFLEDGKLLLRGGNGSGKSVTLQSFIPLLLDGNRSPSRLDPFGSASRKLENYMLMDEQEEERTAYLYMEMKKQDSENYITVGMGIKAQKDKTMDTWYFIIRDGKRIGKDIELLKKSSEGHVVLQKKQLKNLLQENNFFTEHQNRYMEKMNEIFFGFADIGNYQDLLSLIINIRAPKLSKDLKPTKMYDILNKSLKTLDEEELRGVTDSIEDMERISNKIEDQRRALKSAKEIEEVYREYNRTILSVKKLKYNQKKYQLEFEKKKTENLIKEFKEITNLIEKLHKKNEEIEIETKGIVEKKNLIQHDDLFWKSQQKIKIEKNLKLLKTEKERLTEKYIDKIENRKKKIFENGKLEKELKELNENYSDLKIKLDARLKNLGIISLPNWYELKDELKKFKELMNSVKKEIREYESYKSKEEKIQDDLEKNSLDIKQQHKETLRLENLLIEISEETKENFIKWQNNVKYFKFSDREQITIFDLINSSVDSSGENKMTNISDISKFVKEQYFILKNGYEIKLDQLKIDFYKKKNVEKLEKENIPFRDLKKSTGLDIVLIKEEFKDKVSKFAYKDGGHFLFSSEELSLKENGNYEIGGLLGKNPYHDREITQEQLEEILEILESEFKNFPLVKDLEAGKELLLKNSEIILKLKISEEELKNRLEEIRNKLRDLDNIIYPKIKGTVIEKSSELIDTLEELREESFENLNEIISKEREKDLKNSKFIEREEDIEFMDTEIDEYNQILKNKSKEIILLEQEYSSIVEILKENGVENIFKELMILEERESFLKKISEKNILELGKNISKKDSLEISFSEAKERVVKFECEVKTYEGYYLQELNLGHCQEENISSETSESSIKQLEFSLNEIVNKNANDLQQFRVKFRMIFQENEDSQRINCIYTMDGKENPFTFLSESIQQQLENLEILLTKNNKKIFEETLIETLGNKVLAEVQNSQRWIKGINDLMDKIESSSSLKLELKWNPKKSEIEGELDTQEITSILKNRDRISEEEIRKFREHFSKKIKNALRFFNGENPNASCHTIVKEVLDYRDWFNFKLYYTKKNEKKREMTNTNFEQFSGGEKAISMYLPLLAALYARYDGASESSPRIVAMDEAFAGVDEKNISLLFSHLENLDLDYIMNSQILWGDYETIPKLAITEIIREENDRQIALINYRWNGQRLSDIEVP